MEHSSLASRAQELAAGLSELLSALAKTPESSGRTNSPVGVIPIPPQETADKANIGTSSVGQTSSTTRATPVPITSVESELRNRFAPYANPLPNSSGASSVGLFKRIHDSQINYEGRTKSPCNPRRRMGSMAKQKRDAIFSRKVVFLGSSIEKKVPDSNRLAELDQAGLKEDVVFSTRNSTNEEFYFEILKLFQSSAGKNFSSYPDVKWTVGYVRGRGVLNITYFEECPSPAKIIALKIACLYLKPNQDLVPLIIELDISEESNQSRDFCSDSAENVDEDFRTSESAVCNDFTSQPTYIGMSYLEFRTHIRLKNPGYSIIEVSEVSDESIILEKELTQFVDKIDIGTYPRMRLTAIEAHGTIGPLRAYTWTMLRKILLKNTYNGVSMFEGKLDHLVPARDACLRKERVFYSLGRFLAFSILNIGIGFFGLCSAVPMFLLGEEDEDALVELICEDDIPYEQYRSAVLKMTSCVAQGCDEETMEDCNKEVREVLLGSSWTYPLKSENILQAINHVKYFTVISIRRDELLQLRSGFRSTEVCTWLGLNKQLMQCYFKRASCIASSVTELVSAFGTIDVSIVCSFNHLCNYLQYISEDTRKISQFVKTMTESSILGNQKLHMCEDTSLNQFTVDTRKTELRVIPNLSQEEFFEQMEVLIAKSEEELP